ncbi:hypothetical protein [Thalassobellus suaedae]|uniref:Cardiolipin synthetase n=1 Tax=Thalassobellus suaedae TaxID=3074124 RepID=A0ABY9Y340_9FLAO|nr:hypothetical protein RHP49_17430 [Flavobacteriaceae bacterium HL-DH10]
MKYVKIIILCLLMVSCSSVELVDNWKNPDIDTYIPNKVLLIGMTSNYDARKQFEKQLQEEFTSRGIESVMSLNLLKSSFTSEKKTKEELKSLESNLIDNGFDTILLTKVIGVEDKIEYKKNYDGYDSTYRKFKEDYLKYQDVFYNPDYYEEYTIYHTETSMYCICSTKNRDLLWKGYIDIMDPQSIHETINDYVQLILIVLEEQQLITPKIFKEENTIEAIQ